MSGHIERLRRYVVWDHRRESYPYAWTERRAPKNHTEQGGPTVDADIAALLADYDRLENDYAFATGKRCLTCGKEGPCELNQQETSPDPDNWPGSPCTFDIPASELYRRWSRARKVLRQVEWSQDGIEACPSCGRYSPKVHEDDCAIAEALAD